MTKPRIRVHAASRAMLTVVPFKKPEADPDITRAIGQFEERAADGSLVSVAIVGVNRDGSVSSAYVVGPQLFALMGAVHHLQRRVSSELETK